MRTVFIMAILVKALCATYALPATTTSPTPN